MLQILTGICTLPSPVLLAGPQPRPYLHGSRGLGFPDRPPTKGLAVMEFALAQVRLRKMRRFGMEGARCAGDIAGKPRGTAALCRGEIGPARLHRRTEALLQRVPVLYP